MDYLLTRALSYPPPPPTAADVAPWRARPKSIKQSPKPRGDRPELILLSAAATATTTAATAHVLDASTHGQNPDQCRDTHREGREPRDKTKVYVHQLR